MYILLVFLFLTACGRPADEDCWRGPVPIVRDCDCRSGPTLGISLFPLDGGSVPKGRRGSDEASKRGRDAAPITLRITRLMIDPEDVPDRDGEWIEVHNPTPLPADVEGMEVAVNGTPRCVLGRVTIPAFGYLLLARKGDPDHHPCPRLSLPNRGGEAALVRDGEVLDRLVWEKAPKGISLNGWLLPPRPSLPRPG